MKGVIKMSDLWEHDMYINENDPYLFNTDISSSDESSNCTY